MKISPKITLAQQISLNFGTHPLLHLDLGFFFNDFCNSLQGRALFTIACSSHSLPLAVLACSGLQLTSLSKPVPELPETTENVKF